MKLFCSAEGCNSSSDKKKDLSKYPWMADITFHTFPTALKNKKMRKRWLDMVRRQNFEPNYHCISPDCVPSILLDSKER